jgi:hypothetical protein
MPRQFPAKMLQIRATAVQLGHDFQYSRRIAALYRLDDLIQAIEREQPQQRPHLSGV